MNFKLLTIISASLILVGSLTFYNFIEKDENVIVYKVGDIVPNKELQKYNDDTKYSISNSSDKIKILNFWGIDCTSCIKELPDFNDIFIEYKQYIDVIAIHEVISKTYQDDVISMIENRFSDFDKDFIFAQDEDIFSTSYYKMLGGIDAMPYTVIIDQENVIYKTINGSYSYDKLKVDIDNLLKN